MNHHSAIIHLPQRQAPAERTFYRVATLLVWILYAWLWLPLATLVLWVLGLRLAVIELYLAEQRIDPHLLVWLPLLLLACATVLIGWAEYNRRRFAGRDRRQGREDVTPAEVARAMGADAVLATELGGARSAVLVMDGEGRPLALRQGPAAPVPHDAPGATDGMVDGDALPAPA